MIDETTLLICGVSKDLSNYWGPRFSVKLPEHGIEGITREAAFLGQVLHESALLRRTRENLNYSEKGLLATFGKYFTKAQAKDYARNPERIANRVYANRMGNGDEASGDGWHYRGEGFIQSTGRDNQETYRMWAGDPGPINPLLSAIWFWLDNGLNEYADRGDMRGMTKRINGGFNGFDDRLGLTRKANRALVA